MTQEESFHKIVMFFYLVTLNDRKTHELAIKASQLYQTRKASEGSRFDDDSAVIEICTQLLDYSLTIANNQLAVTNPSFLIWPENLDFIPWRDFHKKSTPAERIAVVWVNILGVSISKLALALATSEGTIRYRLNKGLALLGQLNRPNFRIG